MQGILFLIGRILLSLIFIMSGFNKIMRFSGTAEHMLNQGIPLPNIFLVGAIIVEIVAGLMVLIGFQSRIGALLLFLYLIPTTLIFHDFWAFEGQDRQNQIIQFMKNLAIMGGLLTLMASGPGTISIEGRRRKPSTGL